MELSNQVQNEPVAMEVTDLAATDASEKQEGPDPFQDAAVLLVHEVLGSVIADLPKVGPPSLEKPADLPPAEPAVPRSMSVGTQTGRGSRKLRKRKISKGAAALPPVKPSKAPRASREQRGRRFKWWLDNKAKKTMRSVPVATPRNPHSCGSGVRETKRRKR